MTSSCWKWSIWKVHFYTRYKGCRGRDRMVVGFTTTYAVSAYQHWCCEFESRSGRGVQHYVIKFVSDLPVTLLSIKQTNTRYIVSCLKYMYYNKKKMLKYRTWIEFRFLFWKINYGENWEFLNTFYGC
jgi:hypothetical protein